MTGGVAHQHGYMEPGDRIVHVNHVSLEKGTDALDAAVQLLKRAPFGLVWIGVSKPVLDSPPIDADTDRGAAAAEDPRPRGRQSLSGGDLGPYLESSDGTLAPTTTTSTTTTTTASALAGNVAILPHLPKCLIELKRDNSEFLGT